MKQIENIFSKDKIINEIPHPKISIIVDTCEKPSMISAELLEQNANIKFEKLEIADYLIGNVAIERKTFRDFISSMINKRLFKQSEELKNIQNIF